MAGEIPFVKPLQEEMEKAVIAAAKRELGYLFCYKRNVDGLKAKVETLGGVLYTVQHKIDKAKNNGEEIDEPVSKWRERVQRINEEVVEFLKDEHRVHTRCFKVRCPHPCTRHRLGKESTKKTATVTELIEVGDKFQTVSHRTPFEDPRFPSPSSTFGGSVNLGSREGVFKKILDALRDDTVEVVGIYGMPGVGKTKMAGDVRNQVLKEKLFHKVTMAVVSQVVDEEKIQRELAACLDLDLKGAETTLARADLLQKRLQNGEKILLILDDVWTTELDLKNMGINFGENTKGSKILLTSRSRVVCERNNCQNPFLIEILNETEAWDLFKLKAGNSVYHSKIRPVAEQVCKECGCLPLVIQAVASALKGKDDKPDWDDALLQLTNSNLANINDIDSKVFESLEWSYKQLKPEEAKSCLLLCSLFREDAEIPIDDLVQYAKAMGLFQRLEKLEQVRNRVFSLVNNLEAACLLLKGRDEYTIKLHDVIRDVAISLASKDDKFTLLVENGVSKWPETDTYSGCKAISLRSDKIRELPEELECPQLHTLVLEGRNLYSPKVPDTFFNGLNKLKVLHLSRLNMHSPPSSLLELTDLRMLCVSHSGFRDISKIGALKQLEMLIISDDCIVTLLEELGELKHLRLLDLRGCKNLKVVPPGVFSSLSDLEELYFPDDFTEWVVESTDSESRSRYSIIDELSLLTSLTALQIKIQDCSLFPHEELCKRLNRFKITVGRPRWFFDGNSQNILAFCPCNRDGDTLSLKGHEKLLMEKAIVLKVESTLGLNKVFNDVVGEGFADLKLLHVQGCPDLEHLLSYGNNNQLPPMPFLKLSELKVISCQGLKYLFCPSIARELVQLRRLEITLCFSMEDIIRDESQGEEGEDEIMDPVIFGQLEYMELWGLPSLTSFYGEIRKTSTTESNPSTPRQCNLFNGKVAFPAIEELEICRLPNVRELWENQSCGGECFSHLRVLKVDSCDIVENVIPSAMLGTLQNLKELKVENCKSMISVVEVRFFAESFVAEITPLPRLKELKLTTLRIMGCKSLKYVFSPFVAKFLVHLREWDIFHCEEMEEIIAAIAKGAEEIINEIVFPQLKHLALGNLRNLKSFWQRGFEENKEDQEILQEVKAHMNQPHTFFSHKVVLPALEELVISRLPNVEGIWESQSCIGESFSQLRKLEVDKCNLVENLIPSAMLGTLQNLEELKVEDCKSMISVVEVRNFAELFAAEITTLPQIRELNLTILSIKKCKSLKYVFSPFAAKFLLLHLQELRIVDCEEMEEIIAAIAKGAEEIIDEIVFPQLKLLELKSLPKLKHFWGCGFEEHEDEEGEEILQEVKAYMNQPQPFISHKLSFPSVRNVQILCCDRLGNLFSSYVARTLQELRRLEIRFCGMIEEIVVAEGDKEMSGEIVFPQLNTVDLKCLPELISFCSANYAFNMPSLKNLNLDRCAKMQFFTAGQIITPSFDYRITDHENCATDLNTYALQVLNSEKRRRKDEDEGEGQDEDDYETYED